MQSEQTSETAGAEIEAQDIPDGMSNLAELLQAGEEVTEREQDQNEAEPGGSHEEGELRMFNDLADKLGIELDDLYKLQITSSEDGEPVTIEALKDLHKGKSDFEIDRLEWEEQRSAQEQNLTRAKAELQELFNALPQKAIKPELLERIRAKHDKQVATERAKTLEVIPQWKDAKVRQAEIEGMSEHLQGYGFPVNYLEGIVSSQQLKYIRDNWQREQRVRKALEQVRAGKPGKTPASKAQKSPPSKTGSLSKIQRGNARNRLEAVFSDLE